jgi:hypothetical protein
MALGTSLNWDLFFDQGLLTGTLGLGTLGTGTLGLGPLDKE